MATVLIGQSANSKSSIVTPPATGSLSISKEDIAAFARDADMSTEDASFVANEGSKTLVDFTASHANDADFGGVWFGYRPFTTNLRVTVADSPLIPELTALLGKRTLTVVVGGASLATLRSEFDRLSGLVGSEGIAEVSIDDQRGLVRVAIADSFAGRLPDVGELAYIDEVRVGAIVVDNYAGAPINSGLPVVDGCTVGYTARRLSDNWAGIVTAGHCPDTGTVNGQSMWPAEYEACASAPGVVERQVHPITGNTTYTGFYDYNNNWTLLVASAGGTVAGQMYFRRGRYTKSLGTVRSYVTYNLPPANDCGGGDVQGIKGFITSCCTAVSGDSGGLWALAYGGQWYLAGIHEAHLSDSTGTHEYNQWISLSLPPGWKACTHGVSGC